MSRVTRVVTVLVAILAVVASGVATVSIDHALSLSHAFQHFDASGAVLASLGALGLPAPLDIGPAKDPAGNPLNTLLGRKVVTKGAFRVYEGWLYDTMTYVQAGIGAAGLLKFFQTAANGNDDTLCNMGNPGRLPKGQFFHPYRLFMTYLQEPSLNVASTAAGRIADLFKVMYSARSFLYFLQQSGQINRTPIPLDAVGQPSAVLASLGGNNTAPAEVHVATPDRNGGYPFTEPLVEEESFAFNLKTGVATAISADMPLRLGLFGWQYVTAG